MMDDDSDDLNQHHIANILAAFLRFEPENKPISIPPNRLKQLLRCARSPTKNDATLLESVGSIYAIALIHASVSNFDLATVTKGCLLLQTIQSECLVVMQASGTVKMDILQPSDFLEQTNVEMLSMYDVFLDSLNLAKEFLREITWQVRASRDESLAENRLKTPIDCFQPHALYFMCSFGIAHIAAVLNETKQLFVMPGITESLALMGIYSPNLDALIVKNAAVAASRAALNPYEKKVAKLEGELISREDRCLQLASSLSIVVMSTCLDEAILQELRIVRQKMIKAASSPGIPFVRLHMDTFKRFTEEIRSIDPVLRMSIGNTSRSSSETMKKSCRRLDADQLHPVNRSQFEIIFAVEAAKTAHEMKYADDIDAVFGGAKPAFDVDRHVAIAVKAAHGSAEINKQEIVEDTTIYLKLKPHLRLAYLCARCLWRTESIQSLFPRGYAPKKKRFGDIAGLKTLSSRLDLIESCYFHSDEHFCPRHINASQYLYWIAVMTLECFYIKTLNGTGFDRPIQSKIAELKGEVSKLQKQRLAGSNGALPSLGNRGTASTVAHEATGRIGRSSGGAMLMQRLMLAKEEAQVERTLSVLEDTVNTSLSRERECQRLKLVDQTLIAGVRVHDELKSFAAPVNPTRTGESASPLVDDPLLAVRGCQSTSSLHTSSSDAVIRDIGKFRSTMNKRISESRAGRVSEVTDGVSVVWRTRPLIQATDPTSSFASISLDNAMTMKEASKKYAEYIHKAQDERREAEEKLKRDLGDQQEIEVGKSKASKLISIQDTREARKALLRESLSLKKKFAEEKKRDLHFEKLHKKQMKLKEEEDNEREKERIVNIKSEKQVRVEETEMIRRERFELDKIRRREMADAKEMVEIIRRYEEEFAMKACEEKRRILEERRLRILREQEQLLQQKRATVRELADRNTARVRMGKFHWHDGKIRFYDEIRRQPVQWYQYEDDEGVPYYFDPITNKTQYRPPVDAPIRNHIDDIRDTYDLEHGEGAYDAMIADLKFKADVNEQGGWYDDNREWVVAHGYYDDNGEWVAYEGYVDEDTGQYVRFAKVTGDLSFMV